MIYKGVVKGNVVQLEEAITLPEGMRVSVIPEESVPRGGMQPLFTLHTWVQEARQVRAHLPPTRDSVELLQQLREERASR
jgi:hypothetical protein